jgi:hypothetical protein
MSFIDEFDGEKRYREDAEFRSLVDVMESMIQQARFTPTELRQAVMLAAIRYEMRTVRDIYVDPEGQLLLRRSLYR